MPFVDKRELGRVPVAMDVTHCCRVRVASCRATNLSSGGIQVKVRGGGIECGDRLAIEFMIPEVATRILCDAEVVYRFGRVAGLRFVYIPWPMRRDLDEYVSAMLAVRWFI